MTNNGGMEISNVKMPSGEKASITIAASKCSCGRRNTNPNLIILRAHGKTSKREYDIVRKEMEATLIRNVPAHIGDGRSSYYQGIMNDSVSRFMDFIANDHNHQNRRDYNIVSYYQIISVQKVDNCCLWKKYRDLQKEFKRDLGYTNEFMLFHGSPKVRDIVRNGFDDRKLGPTIYFSQHTSTSNQFVFPRSGCRTHGDKNCFLCQRQMLLCRVTLGKLFLHSSNNKITCPSEYDSAGRVLPRGECAEYAVFRGSQAYPEYLITYRATKKCHCKTRSTDTKLVQLQPTDDVEYEIVESKMNSTIRSHKLTSTGGGQFTSYKIVAIHKLVNCCLWKRFRNRQREIAEEVGYVNEQILFHGSAFVDDIVKIGFDERKARLNGMFGAGIYFAQHSSKSNQYVYGYLGGTGCQLHSDKSCYICERKMLLCRVTLGNSHKLTQANKLAHPPPNHHSVKGVPSQGWLQYPEYVVYRGEQAYPEFLITYKIVK